MQNRYFTHVLNVPQDFASYSLDVTVSEPFSVVDLIRKSIARWDLRPCFAAGSHIPPYAYVPGGYDGIPFQPRLADASSVVPVDYAYIDGPDTQELAIGAVVIITSSVVPPNYIISLR